MIKPPVLQSLLKEICFAVITGRPGSDLLFRKTFVMDNSLDLLLMTPDMDI